MAILLQLRRGSDVNNSLFVGDEGEASVDLIKKTLRIHVGDNLPGGYELARNNLINVSGVARTLTPSINAVHDLGSNSLRFKDLYLSNKFFIGNVNIESIPEGIRVITNTGSFDLTQGIDEGSSPTFTSITIGDTTISELPPFGIRVTKGATQLDLNQSLTTTSNVQFNSLAISSELTIGNTSITEDPNGISFDNGTNVISLNQSLKDSDDVTFNTITGDLIGNADTATKLKTPFSIEVTGDVEFSVNNIDGSGVESSTNATLKTITTAATHGDQSRIPVITVNEKGLVTSVETRPVVAIATDFIIVEDVPARDALEPELLKVGMLVLTKDTNFLWQLTELNPDLSGGVTTDTKWSEINKDSTVTLSNNALTAENSVDDWGDVFGTKGRNSGKYYFEVINSVDEEYHGEVGLSTLSKSVNMILEFNDPLERTKRSGLINADSGLSYAAQGDRIRVAVDFDSGKVWFAVGTTWEFLPGSVDSSLTFTPNVELYPFISIWGSVQKLTIASNPADFQYSPPTDFLPWSEDIPINPPIPVWERFYVSPTRKIIEFTTPPMDALSYHDFDFMLGNCLIVYKLQVTEQCTFEVHENSSRADINPYKYVTPTLESPPFVDNGLTYLADGAILRGRRYHIWASMEGGFEGDNRIYGRIYNHTENNYPSGITVTIWYMPIEKSAIFA